MAEDVDCAMTEYAGESLGCSVLHTESIRVDVEHQGRLQGVYPERHFRQLKELKMMVVQLYNYPELALDSNFLKYS